MSAAPDWIVPEWPAHGRVRALITTRSGGASAGGYAGMNLGERVGDEATAVAANRARLRRVLPAEPVWLRQVHGTRIVEATEASRGAEADGAVARGPGRVCAVLTADCLPVLFSDGNGSVVGIAHAGWRGLAGGVIENALQAMDVAPGGGLAYLGPAIGARAYEVGPEVRAAFTAHDPRAAEAFAPRPGGKFLADLYRLARQRLAAAGCHRVYGEERCTYSDPDCFYSFRRDGVTGRMASLVWIDGA